ncbi:MAG: multicopper oxidase domain-containing protein, partial [Acidobacteriota bacterium]
MERRDFLKRTMVSLGGLIVGTNLPSWILQDEAYAATQSLSLTFTDAVKQMVTFNAIDPAVCYFWAFKASTSTLDIPVEVPGPHVFAFEGDTINLTLSNMLPHPHRFSIPAANIFSCTLPPGARNVPFKFLVPRAGTYLYYDDLNEPVNRVMGLHGALVSMPRNAIPKAPGRARVPKVTPYSNPSRNVQRLFNDLGSAPWLRGLAWEEGDTRAASFAQSFRQYVWLLHEASPVLFAEVGNFRGEFPAELFKDRFLRDRFVPGGVDQPPAAMGHTPQYFTLDGQSGHFAHTNPFVSPYLRVGEPAVVRVLNAGLWDHSLHLHGNHFFLLQVNHQFNQFPELDLADVPDAFDNVVWLDTYTARPLDVWDILVPLIRPPDNPNDLGIGRADLGQPLPVDPTPIQEFGVVIKRGEMIAGPTPPGETTWPPVQELHMSIPKVGTKLGDIPIHAPLSPICFAMHDHSEPTQTSQGANYTLGMMAGLSFTGDRN